MKEGDEQGRHLLKIRSELSHGFGLTSREDLGSSVGTWTRVRVAFGTLDDADGPTARKEMIHQNAELDAFAEHVDQVFTSAVVVNQ